VLPAEPLDNAFAEFDGKRSQFSGFSSAYSSRCIVFEAIPFAPAGIQNWPSADRDCLESSKSLSTTRNTAATCCRVALCGFSQPALAQSFKLIDSSLHEQLLLCHDVGQESISAPGLREFCRGHGHRIDLPPKAFACLSEVRDENTQS